MRAATLAWLRDHRRVLALKAAVAMALTFAHFYPESRLGLVVNLVWLALF